TEDRLALGNRRAQDRNEPVEPPRTGQGRIEDIWTGGGADDDHTITRIEPIQLDEELIQRSIVLVVYAVAAALPPQRVDFVNKDDPSRPSRLLEHGLDAVSTETDDNPGNAGRADREERHACLACDRPGNQGFT